MLFRTGLRIPFVLALFLGFAGFFFKVPTTEAVFKCFECEYPEDEDCEKPEPGAVAMYQCRDQATSGSEKIPVCVTMVEGRNGKIEKMFRTCFSHGNGEFGKCLDDAPNYPPKEGCEEYTKEQSKGWDKTRKNCTNNHIKEKENPKEIGVESSGGREWSGGDGKLALCTCTGNLCNSQTCVLDLCVSGTVPSTRGSEGVIFSLTLLIHLYLHLQLPLFGTDGL